MTFTNLIFYNYNFCYFIGFEHFKLFQIKLLNNFNLTCREKFKIIYNFLNLFS